MAINHSRACTPATDLRHQAEQRLKLKIAATATDLTDEELTRIFHELQVYQIELEMQNEALLHSREELEMALLRYTDLYDFAPVSYFTLNRRGDLQSANLTAATLLGIERSLLLGRRFSHFIVAEHRRDFGDFLEKTFLTRGKESCELELIAGADLRIFVRIEAIASSEEGECRLVVSDISEGKRLEELNAHLASFPELNPNPVLEFDTSGRIKYTNPATLKILESHGMTAADAGLFLPAEMRSILQEWDGNSKAEYNSEIVIYDRYYKESMHLSPHFKTARVYAFDFTEQKKAEEAQRVIEELNRKTLQALSAHIAVIDRQGRIIAVNQAWTQFSLANSGGDPVVTVGANYYDVCRQVVAEKDAAEAAQALAGIEAVVAGEQELFAMEYPCHSPQQQRWFFMTVVPLGTGGESGAVISHTDISVRKEIEAALRQKRERLQLALEAAQMATWDWNVQSGEIVWNDIHFRMLGYEPGEVVPCYQAWACRVHPDDKDNAEQIIRQNMAVGGVYANEFRVIRPDGTVRWLEARGAFEYDEKRQPLRCYGVMLDMTESKEAGENLAKAHAELEQRVAERTSQLSATVEDLVRAEDNLHKLNRLYLILSETGKAIASISSRDELFRDICRIAVERGGFRMVWIGLLEGESGLVKPAEAFGFSTDYLESVRISSLEEAEGSGPTGKVIRNGGHYICNDFMADPNTGPWQAEAKKRGFRASAAFAITLHGRTIGALTMYADEKNYFDQPKIELLLQMQTDISFALDNMDRDARRREAEAELQHEIAERLRIMEELRQKELLLLQQSRQAAMGEMINNISHQWRQPLNSLSLIIQKMLLFCDSPEFNREFLENNTDKAMQLIQHMSQTIESFRNFFRTDKEKVLIDLNELVLRTIALVKQTFDEQKVAITFKAAPGQPKIYGYPNEYSQVILIILFNARDQLLGNCVDNAGIVMKAFITDATTVLTITDNGGGVAKEILGKLFEPYFTTKGPDKGTGIGLFMAKTIIETNMGGRLTVRNVNNGAQFIIEVQNEDH